MAQVSAPRRGGLMGQVAKRQEAHTLYVEKVRQDAVRMIDEAWVKMNTPSSTRIGAFFDSLAAVAKKVVGLKGQDILREAANYIERQYGFRPEMPQLADLGNTVEDFTDTVDEHTRHSLALLRIWIRRMRRQGMDPQTITKLVKDDFKHGKEHFGLYKNSLKRAVREAIQQIDNEAKYAAVRAKESDG